MAARPSRPPVDETITLGHTCIGRVKEVAEGFICFDADGVRLGTEKTVHEARKVLHRRHEMAGGAA